MTDIAFYHLQKWPLEKALPKLLEKTLDAGKRAVVMAGSAERLQALNTLLWTYDRDSWLPHGTAREGNAEDQPVWLTTDDENPNGAASVRVAGYERCFELFDGNDSQAVDAARGRWQAYKDAGHALTYWQQTVRGGWEEKG